MTTEQKSWQLLENGVEYCEIASTANQHGCSMNWAIELIWDSKLGPNKLSHSCQPKGEINGIEIGCCNGK